MCIRDSSLCSRYRSKSLAGPPRFLQTRRHLWVSDRYSERNCFPASVDARKSRVARTASMDRKRISDKGRCYRYRDYWHRYATRHGTCSSISRKWKNKKTLRGIPKVFLFLFSVKRWLWLCWLIRCKATILLR